MHAITSSNFLDHHEASNTSNNDEPLGSHAGRASSTLERSDGSRRAGRLGSAGTGSAGSDTRSDHGGGRGALAVEPDSGGGNGKGDGQGGEVGVSGHGDGGSVLDDSWGAADGGDGRLLDGAGRGDVSGGNGGGGCEADGAGHGGGTGPDRGAGHVAVGVDAALGADGGVDAGHLGGGDVGHGGGSRVSRGRGVARDDRDGGVAGGGSRRSSGSDSRGAGRAGSDGRRASSRRRAAGGRAGAGGNSAVLVLGVVADNASNVLSSLAGVQLEVVGVGLDGVGTKANSADQIVNVAVVVESRGVGVETSKTSGITVAVGLAGSSAQDVVRLVSSVPGVTEQSNSGDVASDTRSGVGETSVSLGGAEGITTVASQDVADDSRALTVAAQHDGGLGALGIVGVDLLQRKKLAGSDRWAVVGRVGIVGDVLVVTALARKVGANLGSEVALTAGV
jgi:hypothetical protein